MSGSKSGARLRAAAARLVDGVGRQTTGGNFHGMPLAMAMDHVTVALCHVAGIAERRINWLLTASDSENISLVALHQHVVTLQ